MKRISIRIIPIAVIVSIVQLVLGKPIWIALLSGLVGAIAGVTVLWAYNAFFKKT